MSRKDELKNIDCTACVSRGFGEGTDERGAFKFNPETGKVEAFEAKKKSLVNAPAVHGDEILDGVHSMADDKTYYSRSAYKRSLKEQGYEITGGDHLQVKPKQWKPDIKEIREDAEKAYYDIKYARVPISEKSKQLNLEEERQWKEYQKRQRTKWA